jgi:hypothetical protein
MMRGDFDEDEYDDEDDWQCFEDTCVCTDGMCGESEADDSEPVSSRPASVSPKDEKQ